MAGSLNRVTIVGNVGRDPESKSFSNGGKVVNFSVATSEAWKDKQTGEKKEKTEWHNVAVFQDGLTGIVESYVRKGSKVLVEGKLQTRSWDKDGEKRYSTEIVLQGPDARILLLGDGGQGGLRNSRDDRTHGNDSRTAQQAHQETRQIADLDDEVPF